MQGKREAAAKWIQQRRLAVGKSSLPPPHLTGALGLGLLLGLFLGHIIMRHQQVCGCACARAASCVRVCGRKTHTRCCVAVCMQAIVLSHMYVAGEHKA